MIVEHNLGVKETVAMATILTCAKIFLGMPRHLAELAGPSGWLIMLLSALHGLATWAAVRTLVRRFPGKSLITATEAALGPLLGSVVNLTYFAYFAFLSMIVTRQFADAESGIFLLRTPLPVLILALLGTSLFMAYLGIEPICRTAALGGPLMLMGLVLLLLAGLATHTEPHALAPYLGNGLAPILSWGLIKDTVGDLLILGVLAPSFRKQSDLDRIFLGSFLLCSFILVGCTVVMYYVFPYPASARVALPLLQISRTISLGPGVQRVESLFFLIWLVGGLIKVAVTFYAASSILAQVLRLPSYRHLFPALAILLYAIALLPPSSTAAAAWDDALRNAGSFITVVLPWLTVAVALVRGKRGEASVAG